MYEQKEIPPEFQNDPGYTEYVPLIFFFNRETSLLIPTAALPYEQYNVQITYTPLNCTPLNCTP
jgi:hypothetical protein